MTDVGGNLPSDPFERAAADLAANEWWYALNAAGTSLAPCFNYSGEPVGFPPLAADEQLVVDFVHDTEDVPNVPGSSVVEDLDAMTQWYNAGRFGVVGVTRWRIAKKPEDV